LNFQNIEVRALLQVIADFTNFTVVTSDTVTGNVTLRLKDVPWDQALDIILQAKGLGLRKSGNVILIAPKDELTAKEKVDLESRQQIAALEPVRTQAFQLNYTKAEVVAKGLTGQDSGQGGGGSTTTRLLSPRGSVLYETRTNQLFVSDIPSKLEEIQTLIAKIDIPVRQVLIEARIVEADDSFGRSLGVKLGFADLRGPNGGVGYGIGGNGGRVSIGGNLNAVGAQTGQTNITTVPFNDTNFVNLPATAQGGYNPATFALSLFGSSVNRFLNLEISALEADGRGKVVSSPRLVTADQIKATIQQGTKVPYQRATSSGATAIEFVDATLKLEVTPQITPEGNVILDVEVNKDSIGAATQGVFSINTKSVKTQVLVENGGTVVIGGIFEQTDRSDVTKVPVLGDVPYLGNLFKTKTTAVRKTELLIFLTPKVVSERTAAR
jgi:type IV pilus assembly protein PilQ